MACIFFLPWPFPSHGTASLKLARTLRAAGHDVAYVNIGKEDPRYAANGFRSLLILDDVLPDGLLGVLEKYAGLRLEWQLRRGMPAFLEALDRGLQRLIAEHRPALAIIDGMLPYAALFFHRDGVPSGLLFTVLPRDREPGNPTLPPLTSAAQPARTPLERLRTRLHWAFAFAHSRHAARRLGMHRLYPQIAARCHFPLERLTSGVVAEYYPQLPELITCPAGFDFPRSARAQRFYLGPCIDVDRIEPPFDWNRLQPDRKLAYCALGSQPAMHRPALRFFMRLCEAFAALPEWQAVVAAGSLYEPLMQRLAGSAPANVHIVREAPQLAMLKRAALMVTHGGLGSIKESLYAGVPLAVFPGSGDQFGNGARVVHHGLGDVGSLNRSTPVHIRRLVRHIGASAAIRSRVTAMQARFIEAEHGSGILGAVQQIMTDGIGAVVPAGGRSSVRGRHDRRRDVHVDEEAAHRGANVAAGEWGQ